ncbi:UDP-glucose--hexose-1-phosphate uridylyltransferase [Halobacillus sp. Marseille-P3879]|uniref:UDP-glucose--hexose-1-phosphate uridylyltransferase n=1 Tax=Halobacillus sp. Marseille-P3879 TaxID=2045014 RepID=UPI000C7C570B|nr:UDP-glucose--hexose-1-phosphate uridylyltransferase [Halobacillus sp. Marseille-P3879]
MNIYREVDRLLHYGLKQKLISVWDLDYVRNSLLELFELEDYKPSDFNGESLDSPVPILENMLIYLADRDILPEDSITYRDMYDTKIMDRLIPKPKEIVREFYQKYQTVNPKEATNYFYQLSKASNYIRTNRIAKNIHWYSPTVYGDLEITINLSKPEKDPKAIAAAKSNTSISYPKCLLCKENVGYPGRLDHPARHSHRIIPLELEDERWYLQYSPYVYYNEHAIVFSRDHRPMKISRAGFDRLLHFVEQFPHYFIGSNADLPIVGGSILSHDHFQAGHHEFPMAKAPIEETFRFNQYPDVTCGIVNWPMSVLRLQGENRAEVSELAEKILNKWRSYSDESVGIYSESDGKSHNTVTPIARKNKGIFELDMVLRNNRTSDMHPYGIFHPHQEVHHIKKENIGLIEVMGLAVLPGRLEEEMDILSDYLRNGLWAQAERDERTSKHVAWAKQFINSSAEMEGKNIRELMNKEIGKTFSIVLEHAGVFKKAKEGNKAFRRFMNQI